MIRWMTLAWLAAGWCASTVASDGQRCAVEPVAVVAVTPAEEGWPPILDRPIGAVEFVETPLTAVLTRLAEISEMGLLVHWQLLADAGVEGEMPVTFATPAITLRQALEAALGVAGEGQASLGFELHGRMIEVATREHFDRQLETRIYDVRGILYAMEAWETARRERESQRVRRWQLLAPRSVSSAKESLPCSCARCAGPEEWVEPPEDILVELLQSMVDPDAWRENGGNGTLRFIAGRLVVCAPARTHRELLGVVDGFVQAGVWAALE